MPDSVSVFNAPILEGTVPVLGVIVLSFVDDTLEAQAITVKSLGTIRVVAGSEIAVVVVTISIRVESLGLLGGIGKLCLVVRVKDEGTVVEDL